MGERAFPYSFSVFELNERKHFQFRDRDKSKAVRIRLGVSKTRKLYPSEAKLSRFQASLSSLERNPARLAFKRFSQSPSLIQYAVFNHEKGNAN
jgi:hypothetical protein